MSIEDLSPVEITEVKGKPRWRLAYCPECSDGYRGVKASALKWARLHLADPRGPHAAHASLGAAETFTHTQTPGHDARAGETKLTPTEGQA